MAKEVKLSSQGAKAIKDSWSDANATLIKNGNKRKAAEKKAADKKKTK